MATRRDRACGHHARRATTGLTDWVTSPRRPAWQDATVDSSTVSDSQQTFGTAVREIACALSRADALAAEALLSGLLGKCGGAATLIDYAIVAKQSDAM